MSNDTVTAIKLSKWGNSLGLRLPKVVAESGDFHEGDIVEIVRDEDGFRLRKKPAPSLAELVDGISDSNRHDEIDWGAPEGNEW
jgi:antitoxin MazE